ncbi:unnamed protein product [Rotaria socialis]|uniref:Uncharacterized protein n=5 Tax=Rotaria socialis TaxID=392032 RepID=A0A817VJF4_9BILA|nr:unnamed protein product [Rotaria socialis]
MESFEFLSIFDIFYLFDKLNNRFNQLIRAIPLHLNFKLARQSTFDRLCQLLLLNSEVKKQVYSLVLSNRKTCHQIETFLSHFSLDQFSHLHSLTLIQVGDYTLSKLHLIPQLYSFHLIDSNDINLTYPLTSNLRILSIPTLRSIETFFSQISSITNMTISACSLGQLNIHYLSEYNDWTTNSPTIDIYKAVHLKELIIFNFDYKFEHFQKLAKHLPRLTNFKLYGNCDLDMIDASQWEHLLTSSLARLDIFKFTFNYIYKNNDDINIQDKFNRFQNDFWLGKHWPTEYELSNYSATIYTIPYMFNSYDFQLDTQRYSHQLVNTFDNAKILTVYHATLKDPCLCYFSNVTSLTILPSEQYFKPRLGTQDIRSLKKIINFSNLKHIGISVKFRLKEPSILLRLLQDLPQLSSIVISICALEAFSYDTDLCEYLNKTIKKLDIYKYGFCSFKTHYQLEEFCKTFSNVEELKCNIDRMTDLLFLLKHLSKLTNLKGYLWSVNDYDYFHSWFKKQTCKLNILFDLKYMDKKETELSI